MHPNNPTVDHSSRPAAMDDDHNIFHITAANESVIDTPENKKMLHKRVQHYSPESPDTRDDPDGEDSDASDYSDRSSPPESQELVLRVTTDEKPMDAKEGFVIGSDPEACDIVIKGRYVEKRHLAVRFNCAYGTLLLHNLSKNGVGVCFAHTRRKKHRMVMTDEVLLNNSEVDLDFGGNVRITLVREDDPPRWREYCDALAQRLPGAGPLRSTAASTASSTATSSKNGDFARIRWLGKGGMGNVSKVVERRTGNIYAMKEFTQPMRRQERESMMRLQHDNIVKYAGFLGHLPDGPDGGLAPPGTPRDACSGQLLMEFIDGDDLEKEMRKAPFSPAEARALLRQVLAAVAYLHDNKITHRDIKPSNLVLVSRQPIFVKLVDFGFASEQSTFNTSCGTKLFVGPEIILQPKRDRSCNNKLDVYAIGVLVMYLHGETFGLVKGTDPSVQECYAAVTHWLARTDAIARGAVADPRAAVIQLAHRMLRTAAELRPTARECLDDAYFASPLPSRATSPEFSTASTAVGEPVRAVDKFDFMVTPPSDEVVTPSSDTVVPSKRNKLSPASSIEELARHRKGARRAAGPLMV